MQQFLLIRKQWSRQAEITISAPNELIVKLDEASIDLGSGLISEEEYKS